MTDHESNLSREARMECLRLAIQSPGPSDPLNLAQRYYDFVCGTSQFAQAKQQYSGVMGATSAGQISGLVGNKIG